MKEKVLVFYDKSCKQSKVIYFLFFLLVLSSISVIVSGFLANRFVDLIAHIFLFSIVFVFLFFYAKLVNKPIVEFKKYCSGLSTDELKLAKLEFENMQNNDPFFDFKQIMYAVSMSILLSFFYDGIKPLILNATAKPTKFFIASVILLIVFLTLTFFIYKNSIRNKNILRVINDILIERLNEKKPEKK